MKRGKPLSAAQASAIVDYLRQNATAPGVPLESLSQLLCDACSASPHSFFEECPVRLILRSRALLLKEAKCAPSVATHWSNKKEWSSAYEKAVRAMWDKLQMNMNGPRRSKPSSGSKRVQLRVQQPLVSARQDRAIARPPTVGATVEHTVAGPTTNELHVMARGPMKRGKPLSAAQASAIVDYLRQNATAPGVPLESLSQLLCDACSASPHSFFEECPVRLILRSRALLLKEAKCAPSVATHWSNKKEWSSAYEKAVRAMWDKLQMNMNGPRRSKPSSGSKRVQLRVQQPLVSARQDRAIARPPTVGATVKCTFSDAPLTVPDGNRQHISVSALRNSYPAPGALQAMLPRPSASEPPTNAQQVGQLERVRSWHIERFVDQKKACIFSIGSAMSAVRLWRQQHKSTPSALPPRHIVRSFLERHTVPTLLASANGHIWDARVMAPCDLEQYASMMGMPPTLLNALRTAANTVTAAQIRGLLGQGVHGSLATCIFDRCRHRMISSVWDALQTFGSLGAGVLINRFEPMPSS